MTIAEPKIAYEPIVAANPDGSLKNERHERMALMMAEGFTDLEVWKTFSETQSKQSRKYGKRIYANNNFRKRVMDLAAEKQELERDPIWGEAKWMVNQLWRQAIACQDVNTMKEATKMRLTIAEKSAPPPEESTPSATAKGPGRPLAESAQSKGASIQDIKAKLMRVGRQVDDEEFSEDTEVKGEA